MVFPFRAASTDKADAGHPPDLVSRCEGLRYRATNDESDSCGCFSDASFSDKSLATTSNAEAIASAANSALDLNRRRWTVGKGDKEACYHRPRDIRGHSGHRSLLFLGQRESSLKCFRNLSCAL